MIAASQAPPDPSVIALFGPTGVGKTDIAVALADRLRGLRRRPVAVSADALQVYTGLEILTGAPSPSQQAALEHRLVSIVPVDARFSAGEYARLAHAEIDGLLAQGATPVVVGGTGLYLRAALAELDLKPAPPPELRRHWTHALERDGPSALHAQLARRAPWAAQRIDPHDGRRVLRALELLDLGELTPGVGKSQLWTDEMRHLTALVGVTIKREALYARIDARVDAMLQAGALEQVRAAHAAGASETARRALGFAELLAGDIDAMKRNTRNYARRQLTWMRKLAGIQVLDVTDLEAHEVAGTLLDMIEGHRPPPALDPSAKGQPGLEI